MKNTVLFALALLASAGAAATAQTALRVSPEWLAQHQADPGMVLLHVGREAEYRAGHLPGARFVSLDDIGVDRGELTLELPDAAALQRRLGMLGIDQRSKVVVYYGKDQVSPATRVVFTLYAAGLGERVSLLDGGMAAWRRRGLPISAQVPPVASGAGPQVRYLPVVVDTAFVQSHLHAPGYAVIDARAPVYYDGVQVSGDMRKLRKGHIPGALNIPYTSIVNGDMTLKTPSELAALFRSSGVAPGSKVIVYCHIGQQATAILFAAREAGIDAVLYDGSFEDWTWKDGAVEASRGL